MGQAKLRGSKEERILQSQIREAQIKLFKESEKKRIKEQKEHEEAEYLATKTDQEKLNYFRNKKAKATKRLSGLAALAAASLLSRN